MSGKIIMNLPDAGEFADAAVVTRLTRWHGRPWDLTDRNEIQSLSPDWWAALFVAENHVIHDQDEGFFEYDDISGLYEAVTPAKLMVAFRARLYRAAVASGLTQLARYRKRSFVSEVMDIVRGMADAVSPFYHKRPLLPVSDGILELTAAGVALRAFSPEFRYRHKAPVTWNPKATCPRFLAEFLEPMLAEADDRDLLQRQLGLMLFRINPAQRMCILEGDSASGKTSLANLMIALLGEDTVCQLRSEHLEKQFELDAFRGRSLLLGNDAGANFLNTSGAQTLKGLVSSDLYQPEAKNRRDRRPLRGPFSVLIGTNCRLTPRSQGDAAAWRRRLIVYPCRTPEGRRRIINFLEVLLKTEGSGILAWLVAGAIKAMREINEHGDLILTDVQQARIDQLILRGDVIARFAEQCVAKDPESDFTTGEAHDCYVLFCQSVGLTAKPQKSFASAFEHVVLERFAKGQRHDLERDGKKARGWTDLRLIDPGWRATE